MVRRYNKPKQKSWAELVREGEAKSGVITHGVRTKNPWGVIASQTEMGRKLSKTQPSGMTTKSGNRIMTPGVSDLYKAYNAKGTPQSAKDVLGRSLEKKTGYTADGRRLRDK